MCFLLFALGEHADYPLIVAGNRDEYYSRPSQSAHFWPEAPDLLAGRDLVHGGTWLGITRNGRFASVTNYRDPDRHREDCASRGALVSDYLIGAMSADRYVETVNRSADRYNGFSLVLGDTERLLCYSNRDNAVRVLRRGVHALSNHLLDTPWPKVRRGRERLRRLLAAQTAALPDALLELLADDAPAADGELPRTGVSLERERSLSPIFVRTADYGTRCSTVLLVDRFGNTRFWERSYASDAGKVRTEAYDFALQSER